MEKQQILAGNDVRHSIAVVGHRTETATGADAVRMLHQIHFTRLAVRRLAGGQLPFGIYNGRLQERRLDLQVLGDDQQTEEMPIDTLAAHRILVAQLMAASGGH